MPSPAPQPPPAPPPRDLTNDEHDQLDRDGVVCARQIVPGQWLDRLARGVEAVIAEPSQLGTIVSMPEKGFASDLYMWLVDDDFRALVFDSPLAHLAGQAMGTTTVVHWYDQLFVKEPGAEVPTPWHHDLTFWCVDGSQLVSIWIPLDPVTPTSGGLEYVRGSEAVIAEPSQLGTSCRCRIEGLRPISTCGSSTTTSEPWSSTHPDAHLAGQAMGTTTVHWYEPAVRQGTGGRGANPVAP